MKRALAVASLLLAAAAAKAADPVYIDQLMETPLATLQQTFPTLKTEGCYQLGPGQFLQISIDRKDHKPWRVFVSSVEPCRRPEPVQGLDVRARSGIVLGNSTRDIITTLGRPDTSMEPETKSRKLGDTEYFYVCRVSEGCARHTSIFVTNGVVTAIAEWYSE